MNITNDKVIDFINDYYHPIDDDLAKLRQICEDNSVPLILRETEYFLKTMLDLRKPKRILEIGTAYGYSALFFAKYLSYCTVTTLERSEYMYNIASDNFASHREGERIELITGDAIDNLDNMIANNVAKYDFVFIDAAKSHYKEFFERAEQLSNPGSIVICDNVLMKAYLVDNKTYEPTRRHRTSVKRMKEFIDYLYERKDLSVSLLSDGDGLALILLND